MENSKHEASKPQGGPDRGRRWLLGAGWFGFLISVVGPALANVRSLFPNVVYEPPARVKLGRPEDYAPGSVTFVEEPRIYLFREPDGFRAVSAICTHLRCTIGPFQAAGHEWPFAHSICPCHGSVFGADGKVWRGPAPRDLDLHPVEVSPDGRLIVDTGKTVGKDYRLKV